MLDPQNLPTDNIQLSSPSDSHSRNIKDTDPGIMLMTDLRRTSPYKIPASASLDEVDAKMVACEVRLLFVENSQGEFVGIITSTDLLGEKPLLFATQHNTPITEVTTQDIMTPVSELEAVPLDQVVNSKISDVVEAQKKCHRHHMLVLDTSDNKNRVCGIISVTRTGRLLGIDIAPNEQVEGFSEINQALNS